jgi:hypothetical protein
VIVVPRQPTGDRLLEMLLALELYGFMPRWPLATPARLAPSAPSSHRGVTPPLVEQGLEVTHV